MSNIFTGITKMFESRQRTFDRDLDNEHRLESSKRLIVLGYSVVFFDPKSETRINNLDNL